MMIISNIISILSIIEYRNSMPEQINNLVNNSVKSLDLSNVIKSNINDKINSLNLKDGYTPVKGIDYFDGQSVPGNTGASGYTPVLGKDYFNGKTPEKGVDYNDGVDGMTPIIRCNTTKNRWETSYNNGVSYQVSLDEFKKPVKCTIVNP